MVPLVLLFLMVSTGSNGSTGSHGSSASSSSNTLPLSTCYGEIYGNIARKDKLSRGKFIMLLTFELSSFRENSF